MMPPLPSDAHGGALDLLGPNVFSTVGTAAASFALPVPEALFAPPQTRATLHCATRKRGNDLLDEDEHGEEWTKLHFGLWTSPKRSASLAEECSSAGPCTPQRQKDHPAWLGHPVQTPEAKTGGPRSTPPSSPWVLRDRLSQDIDTALDGNSVHLLALALLRSHSNCCCACDHALTEAVRRQNVRALRFLLENGLHEVDQRCGGKRPLQIALQDCMVRGDLAYKMSELLLQHGACPDACPDDLAFTSPLLDAMRRCCLAIVELLLHFNADPNSKDAEGITSMHILAKQTILMLYPDQAGKKLLSSLLRHGAFPFAMDANGCDPVDYAINEEIRNDLIAAQRWWTRCSAMQVCRMSTQSDETSVQSIPWALPGVFEVVIGFVCG